MSDDMIDIIRAIVRDELKSLRLGDIGIVTSVFAHTDEGDEHNFECNVKLRESDLELRKVPMCTPHIGMASTPAVDDLVLISYVGGDPNRAIIVGRLYSDQHRPPIHKENEWHIESPLGGHAHIKIDEEETIIVQSGENQVSVTMDGTISVTGKEDIAIAVDGNAELACSDCTINASGTINLGEGGDPVITQGSHKCYYTGAPLVGSGSVNAKG